MEERIAKMMKTLNITEEEAKELLAYDDEVDHAKAKDRLKYDLSPEEEKKAKKYANATEHKKVKKKVERKPNELKESIVQAVADFLPSLAENVIITNKNREISFSVGEKNFTWTLVEKRAKK